MNKLIEIDDAALENVSGGAFSIGGSFTIKLPTFTLPDLRDVGSAAKTIFGAVFGLLPKIG